jgi:hypothetical protein
MGCSTLTSQAIELAADSLANVKFVQEKRLIQKYFDEIALDTGKYCYGINDTLKALDMGAVETLIVWENLDTMRHTLRNAAGGELDVILEGLASTYLRSQLNCDWIRSHHESGANFQRRSWFSLARTRKTEKSSSTKLQTSRWNKQPKLNRYSNGSPKSTRSLEQLSSSSPTNLKREVSSSRDSVGSEVS